MRQAICSILRLTGDARRRALPGSVARFASVQRASHLQPQPADAPRISLRDYQEECVETVLTAFAEGRRQVGISLATGSGKTVIFTELLGRVTAPSPTATQTLILVHRRELVEQAARHCRSRYPDKAVDIEMGTAHASGSADITIASIQSINSLSRIDKFDPDAFKLILVDEAHHIVAPMYLRVLDHFGLLAEQPSPDSPALVGVSATFSRFDGVALGKAIKHIVYHKDYIDMIGQKWLADVIFTTVQSKADLSKVAKSTSGDFLPKSLSKAVNKDDINLTTVKSWLARAASRKATLVFCVDLSHLNSLTKMFRYHGVDARFVTGDTPKNIRQARLEAFRNGDFPVMLNCGVFTEGTDIPNIDCVLLARPTKSRNLLVQMIGRGMRLHPGKQNCHVIDMVASIETGVVTTPSLFGLDPDYAVVEADPAKMKQAKERKAQERLREQDQPSVSKTDPAIAQRDISGKITFTDYTSIADLLDDTIGDRYIRAISQYAWVHVGEDRHVLIDGSKGSFLMIEKGSSSPSHVTTTQDPAEQDRAHAEMINTLASDAIPFNPAQFTVRLTPKNPTGTGIPFFRARTIATSATFESAVHAADTYAKAHFLHSLIYARAPWRATAASPAQVGFLNRFRDREDTLGPDAVTKGAAGDMITRMRFGARGRFGRLEQGKRKVGKEKEARSRRRRREAVQVGPVPG